MPEVPHWPCPGNPRRVTKDRSPPSGVHAAQARPARPLAGPQRVEGDWWDRVADAGGDGEHTRNVVRDHWVAVSAYAGELRVFQTQLDEAPTWCLHGNFA